MKFRTKSFYKHSHETPEHPLKVYLWTLQVSLDRPEMGVHGRKRLMDNFLFDRVEFYVYNEGDSEPVGATFVSIGCEDVHFGKVPMMLGMFCDNSSASKTLYKAAIQGLKEDGHNRMVRTKRQSESEYRTYLVNF